MLEPLRFSGKNNAKIMGTLFTCLQVAKILIYKLPLPSLSLCEQGRLGEVNNVPLPYG